MHNGIFISPPLYLSISQSHCQSFCLPVLLSCCVYSMSFSLCITFFLKVFSPLLVSLSLCLFVSQSTSQSAPSLLRFKILIDLIRNFYFVKNKLSMTFKIQSHWKLFGKQINSTWWSLKMFTKIWTIFGFKTHRLYNLSITVPLDRSYILHYFLPI